MRHLSFFETQETFTGPVRVTLVHVARKPATSKRLFPRGDVDNYDKAVLDAITSHTNVWNDDDQVIELHSSKAFANNGEPEGCYIRVDAIDLDGDSVMTYIRKTFSQLWS